MLRIFIILPFLFLPILLYALIAMTAGSNGTEAALARPIFTAGMFSGGDWVFTMRDLVLLVGLLCLFAEVLKSVRTKGDSIINHGLSLGVLIVCIIGFLAVPGFHTSTFFLLMVITLLDVVAGPMLSIVAARRDFGVGTQI
ncbi:hypothetical protein [Hyphomonas sp.]|uniref:hypothetical protein n=1 Tax=Hyphomonas sp. TaxID=87 RepID=UPI00391AED17